MPLDQRQIRLLKEAAKETDPNRLLSLIEEIVKSFEHSDPLTSLDLSQDPLGPVSDLPRPK